MITDTGAAVTPPPALDARDALFVAEYLNDRNPAAACARTGISPRKAAAMMNNPDIAAEIERRLAAAADAPAATVSLDALIADARAAYDVAKASSNASAMVSATQLLARLTGRMDGEAPELSPSAEPVADTRQTARAVMALFREAVLEGGSHIGVAGPGETLVRVPTDLAATVGGEIASEPSLPDLEVFDNGAVIELIETVPQRGRDDTALPPITKWEIRDRHGVPHGLRRNRDDAAALAKTLPGGPAEVSNADRT